MNNEQLDPVQSAPNEVGPIKDNWGGPAWDMTHKHNSAETPSQLASLIIVVAHAGPQAATYRQSPRASHHFPPAGPTFHYTTLAIVEVDSDQLGLA
ncbi:hypothetical protein PanWU01x14_182630 [Parasponia andersonii]|uniref:Uncharacterized protein n=1 Tax=Parasponia andersonii TaxID=3476 RepID=A0A2P5C5E2_PARAD|nr:hypothetical protein PanWU01x14_182630 [Parasponia andersonii]